MAERLRVALTAAPIDAGALVASLASPADGAIASFVGVVRDEGGEVTALDYEAYAPMAERELRRIGESLLGRGDVSAVAMVHRTGSLGVGEVSVVVAAAAPHRAAALDACRDGIEALKREVPIWKREHRRDGARWVDARCQDAGPAPA